MDTLDAADASQFTAVRNESTTPLQALALLNNPFVLRQSEHFAAGSRRSRSDVPGRIRAAFELASAARRRRRRSRLLASYAAPTRPGERLPADRQQQRVPVRELILEGPPDDRIR